MKVDLLLEGERDVVADAVRTALMEDGHLILTGDALQPIADAMERWEAFTALPLAQRQRYHQSVKVGEASGGWMLMREHPVYTSHMSEAERATTEPKQEYGFTVETERTLWPDHTLAPGFSASVKTVMALLDAISRALLGAFEAVLGEARGFLQYEPGYVALKHYPGTTVSDDGLHEHSDAVVFTMLSQDRESLGIRGRDGAWITAPADPSGALVVIPGDWMELFTNGQIPAVRHRVRGTEQPRMSLAFFQGVAPMPVGPLTRFVEAGEEARYPTVQSDIDYVGGESGVPRWQSHIGCC